MVYAECFFGSAFFKLVNSFSASTGIIVAIHNCLYADLLNSRGTDKQKDEFLRPFTNGTIGAFALSEHGLWLVVFVCGTECFDRKHRFTDAGSDVVNISTTARRDGEFFILNGTKAWVTSGCEAKAAIVFATVDRQLGHKGLSGKRSENADTLPSL